MSLLEELVRVSEKAANIARLCRQDPHLFRLLIQEKSSEEANSRFVQDFKTLADVLIQETVRHDIGKLFPELESRIQGEESNTFSNTVGESITVAVQSTAAETSELLKRVLNGDAKAADVLASEVHRSISLEDIHTAKLPDDVVLDYNNVGIWIDPIDSTAEYINGKEEVDENGIEVCGLKCVAVLIGVYCLSSGQPLIGVINQPFHKYNESWHGRCVWGISIPNFIASSLPTLQTAETSIICVSSSESEITKTQLKNSGYKLCEAAGAGYKILLTIVGVADAYVLSKNSTYKWDTCGPQAILRSLSGNLVNYDKVVASDETQAVNYLLANDANESKLEKCCNNGGIIAFRNEDMLENIRRSLK